MRGRRIHFFGHIVLRDICEDLQIGTEVTFVEDGNQGPQAGSVRLVAKHPN
jgi:hypothetical protein